MEKGEYVMKKLLAVTCVAVMGFMANQAFALDFGDQITISDQNVSNANWHGTAEDGEVEPGMQHGQYWDLEGFFQDDEKLTMIGGYDFVNGRKVSYGQLMSGDIFIDVDGDAQYGDIHGKSRGNKIVQERNGYDFVLDMNFDTMTYDVFQLTGNSKTITSYEWQNQGSNPWRYSGGGTDLEIGGSIGYMKGLTNAETGFTGRYHNAVTVDLGFLSKINMSGYNLAEAFTTHFTMQCGNDNLMGAYKPVPGSNPVPEPSTVLLIGVGLFGIVGLTRKNRKK
jgi:opacity protein-like surface antigen